MTTRERALGLIWLCETAAARLDYAPLDNEAVLENELIFTQGILEAVADLLETLCLPEGAE